MIWTSLSTTNLAWGFLIFERHDLAISRLGIFPEAPPKTPSSAVS